MMNGMFGISSPFQGLGIFLNIVPRALPWAGVVCPVGAEESRTLAALRDALLPTLLSGEWRVPPTVQAA